MELKVDMQVHKRIMYNTGISVRAIDERVGNILGTAPKWRTVDICELSPESLLEWLRSRGGENRWAEDTVGIMLGHGPLNYNLGEPRR